MQEVQHKYLENKIHRIDQYENNYTNSDNFPREPPKNIKNSTKTPEIPEYFNDMLTLKVRNVTLPKQTKKKKKLLGKNTNNMENNFSFMPENKENRQMKQVSPQVYEKKFKRYLQQKNKSFFLFIFLIKNAFS